MQRDTRKLLEVREMFGITISYISLGVQTVKSLPAMRETCVQSLGWEDPLEGGNGYPLQYSCLENSMD